MAMRALLCLLLLGLAACSAREPIVYSGPEPAPVKFGRVPPPGAYAPSFDVLHYNIDLDLTRATEQAGDSAMVSGIATLLVVVEDAREDSIRLDLSGMRAVRVDIGKLRAEPHSVEFRQEDGRLFALLDEGIRSGDTIRVVVQYDGRPDDGLIIRRNVHGQLGAFADNWPDRARFWFPAIDHPSDKATVEFSVRAPAGWEVIANGTRVQDSTSSGAWRYRLSRPVPTYLMVVGATDFAIGTVAPCANGGRAPHHANGCVPVTYWVFPQDSANGARIFRRGAQMVEYYSQLIAPFPYERLAHVQSSTIFGGMENATAIFYSEQAIRNGTLSEGTVSHEVAHQWFGDAVTPGHWSDLWLSEGFATYFGNLFFEQADGIERFRSGIRDSWNGYLRSDVTDLAIVDTVKVPGDDLTKLLNRNSYNKGGAVLHMLRGVLGDDVFFRGIRRYYGRHAHGNARTPDFRRAMEEESGRELGWFFDQWLYRPGHPILRVSHSWDSAAGEAVVTLEQVQKSEWPTFRMPVTFEFSTERGAIRSTVQMVGRREVYRLRLPAAPTAVRIDPDGWVLHEMAPETASGRGS